MSILNKQILNNFYEDATLFDFHFIHQLIEFGLFIENIFQSVLRKKCAFYWSKIMEKKFKKHINLNEQTSSLQNSHPMEMPHLLLTSQGQ